ncbi:hypothetical protein B0H11DRAFT_2227609 [Mycena galericulata]|nr:hypothetical protein B0H11DRAFT_2227609 [Mycena galericulata]
MSALLPPPCHSVVETVDSFALHLFCVRDTLYMTKLGGRPTFIAQRYVDPLVLDPVQTIILVAD